MAKNTYENPDPNTVYKDSSDNILNPVLIVNISKSLISTYIISLGVLIDNTGTLYYATGSDSIENVEDYSNWTNYDKLIYAQSIVKQLYSQGYVVDSLEINDDDTYTVTLSDGITKSFDEVYGGGR